VPDIVSRSPRGVILNGDAASREGLVEDYQELRALLEPLSRAAPVYIGFGNHDHRENFKEVFSSPAGVDADRLFAIIRPHRQVKAIFYGHSHAWNISERAGVKLINLPALGYNFWEGEPVGWVEARFRRHGVDLTLRAIAGNRAQDGQTSRVFWA
jgi:hypothetical protein